MQGILNPEKWADIGVGPNCEGCGYPRETRDNLKFFIILSQIACFSELQLSKTLHKIPEWRTRIRVRLTPGDFIRKKRELLINKVK